MIDESITAEDYKRMEIAQWRARCEESKISTKSKMIFNFCKTILLGIIGIILIMGFVCLICNSEIFQIIIAIIVLFIVIYIIGQMILLMLE